MSIRTEPKEMSPGMAQALTLPQHVMTAAQAEGPLMAPAGAETAMVSAPVNDQHLAGANDFNTSNPHHPLKRTVVINIRSSLADLCLKKSRATWSPPSSEATKAIFQQKKCKPLYVLSIHPTNAHTRAQCLRSHRPAGQLRDPG